MSLSESPFWRKEVSLLSRVYLHRFRPQDLQTRRSGRAPTSTKSTVNPNPANHPTKQTVPVVYPSLLLGDPPTPITRSNNSAHPNPTPKPRSPPLHPRLAPYLRHRPIHPPSSPAPAHPLTLRSYLPSPPLFCAL